MSDRAVEELLTLLEQRAPGLRKAGVLELRVGGISARLALPDPPAASNDKPEQEERLDPLDDPRTYGLPPGSKVPGLLGYGDKEDEADS